MKFAKKKIKRVAGAGRVAFPEEPDYKFVISSDAQLDWLSPEERRALLERASKAMDKQQHRNVVYRQFTASLTKAARSEVKRLLADPDKIEQEYEVNEFSFLLHVAMGERADCGVVYGMDGNEFDLADVLGVQIPDELNVGTVEADEIGIVAEGRISRMVKQIDAICEKLGVEIEE